MSKVSISYAITACNEHVELKRLLDQLLIYIESEDEIIVQLDTTATNEVINLIKEYTDKIKFIQYSLNKDFASFKNNLKNNCTKEYIFFIDADEYLSASLISHLKTILTDNRPIECVHVPRVNTVSGLTKEHIQKWRWNVNKKGYINWPDYQTRIIKNQPSLKWEGKVHERICGCQIYTYLPDLDETWALYHPKDIKRQEKQNNLYDTI